jgi:hypothetical protein
MLRSFLLAALATVGPVAAQSITAQPVPLSLDVYRSAPFAFTGALTAASALSRGTSMGSGAVVRHPRIVVSCAHVVFDEESLDPWLTDVRWHRAYADVVSPSRANGQTLRGFFYFTGYASLARVSGNSAEAFDSDFVVHYAYENTAGGGYGGWWSDGAGALLSTRPKLITGYPVGLYRATPGDPRTYIMHQSGPFLQPLTLIWGDYFGVQGVSAGNGNSGGPVWVQDEAGQYLFAGVFVSGSERSQGAARDLAGVYAVRGTSERLIQAAIEASGGAVAAPVIVAQPTSRRVAAGADLEFSVSAQGTGLSYRWLFNGTVIPGANGPVLTLRAVSAAQAGTYQAIVANGGGEVRSAVAHLAVEGSSRLQNVSTRAYLLAGDALTPGFVVRGSGSKRLLIRAIGPTLGQFGVSNPMGDTRLAVSTAGASSPLLENDDWAGTPTTSETAAALGAFPLPGNSRDAATVATLNAGRGYSVRVTGQGGAGVVMAEVYDADPEVAPTRLANVSTLGLAGGGAGALTAGFVVKGSGLKRLLLRGVGPGLAAFGVTGALADPQIELVPLGSATVLQRNDNWGGADTVKAAFTAAGAFTLPDGSLDAAMVVTVPAGGYTVSVTGGSTTGVTLVEIYDLDP